MAFSMLKQQQQQQAEVPRLRVSLPTPPEPLGEGRLAGKCAVSPQGVTTKQLSGSDPPGSHVL